MNVWGKVQCIHNVLQDSSLLAVNVPTTIYDNNKGAVDWCNTTSKKNMHHFNLREKCISESIHEFHEVKVDHQIGGKTNPADLFTKEFKSDEAL